MSIPTQACPVTLQPWQGYYNGWLFGAGTSYPMLEIPKGFDMVALGSQDSQYPRQTGEIIGLDVAKGRDLDLHFWVAPVGQNPAPGGLLKIMEQAVRVQGYVEDPLWLYIPPWPILAFMVRARKRSFPIDLNFSTAGLVKPSLSFHATDPIGYANLKTSDLTAPTANLLTGEDATFIGGVGSWTGSNVTLTSTSSVPLGTSNALSIAPITNADAASISTAQGTASQYQVSGLAGQQITVMASMQSEGPAIPPATLAAPTVAPEGTTGSTVYDYSFAADVLGTIEASSIGSTSTGNATLSSTNYNLVAWTAVPLPAGSSGNLVYDSNLTNAIASVGPTWTSSSGVGTGDGNFDVSDAGTNNAAVLWYGTGAQASFQTFTSQTMAALPNTEYTAACLQNMANASTSQTTGDQYSSLRVFDQSGNFITQVSQGAGDSGATSVTFTTASTVTGLYIDVTPSNLDVPTGDTVSWSQIQLTQTSTVQTYEPGPLWTYDVYRANALIGSTTALAFEDTGQTAGPVGGTFAFQLGVEFYDLAGNSLSIVQSPVFADSQGFWSLISFATNVPSTTATLAVNVTTDALNGTHYLSDVGVFAMAPSANLAPDTDVLSTWTLSSGFGIAASPLGGNEITFNGSGSSSASSQAIYLEAQTEYVISSYLDASNATAGSISIEIDGVSASQDYANTGTVSATLTPTNTGMYQITYNTSSLTVGSGLAVSFAQPQVELGATPSTYVPGQNWFLGAGTGGLIYPVTYPVVYQTQSKKFVAQNNGNWPIYPRVVMVGPLNLPTLTVGAQSFALTNGQTPTIPEGYQVQIDFQTHMVLYQPVGATSGTNQLSWVTNDSTWITIPIGGATVTFASGAQDTGSCTFISADGWFM